MSGYRMLVQSAIASAVAFVCSLVYSLLYSAAFKVDFSVVAPVLSIFAGTVFGTTLICVGHSLVVKRFGQKAEGWYNLLVLLLSFGSILGSFAATLPLDVPRPELFPGMVVPMHFFPALAFWATLPFWRNV